MQERGGESIAGAHGIDDFDRGDRPLRLTALRRDGAPAISQSDAHGLPAIAGRPLRGKMLRRSRESSELVNPLQFLLIELHHIGMLQKFRPRVPGNRRQGEDSDRRTSWLYVRLRATLVQNSPCPRRSRRRGCRSKTSRAVVLEKFESLVREISTASYAAGRGMANCVSPPCPSSTWAVPVGNARSRLKQAGVEIQRRNHLARPVRPVHPRPVR